MLFRLALGQENVFGLDGQLAAQGHGIPRVHGEVHDDLLDLPGVDLDRREPGGGDRDELHVFSDQNPEHLLHPTADVVEVDDSRGQHLLPAEREQVPRQARCALSGALDALEVASR